MVDGRPERLATAPRAYGLVIDRFEVTDRDGAKLSAEAEARFCELLRSGVTAKRRRFGRQLTVRAGGSSA